jgi:hypothetical protein
MEDNGKITLYIADMPRDLHKKCRIAAMNQGIIYKEWVKDALRAHLKNQENQE